jgi:hypothetical protein
MALYTRGMTTGDIRARAAKHETRQHTLGGMSGVGKPAPGLADSPNLRAPLLDRHQANVRA